MRIHLPAETWAEILEWLNRREFAKKMEQLWDREFSPIAEKWLHEWSKSNKIGLLKFKQNKTTKQTELWKYDRNHWYYGNNSRLINNSRLVPIAEVDMPRNICNFKQIRIRYLDNTVLTFLRNMQPLLRNVHLSLDILHKCECQLALDHLLPMFSGEFESVKFVNYQDIALLNDKRYSSTLNTKLLIIGHQISFGLFSNWLFTKRADGQPRMLVLTYLTDSGYHDFITLIQKRFIAATEAYPFIVRFDQNFISEFNERTIRNDKIGQQLIMELNKHSWSRGQYGLFISCPLDMNSRHLTGWKQKLRDWDVLSFERNFQLLSPKFGLLETFNKIDKRHQLNVHEMPETSKALKRNAQNAAEDEENSNCGDAKKTRGRP